MMTTQPMPGPATPGTRSSPEVFERPIIFSGPMIRALLAGRKTQTRRLVDEDRLFVDLPDVVRSDVPFDHLAAPRGRYRARLNRAGAVTIATDGTLITRGTGSHAVRVPVFDLGVKPGEFHFACPYATGTTQLADYPSASGKGWTTKSKWTIRQRATTPSRLWVRETWCRGTDEDASEHAYVPVGDLADRVRGPVYPGCEYPAFAYYRATDPGIVNSNDEDRSPWKSPIHMPRWACRLELDVVHVRIERLQDITEEDAIAEGAQRYDDLYNPRPENHDPPRWSMGVPSAPTSTDQCLGTARCAFANAFQKMHGEDVWTLNPWVWVIEFRPRVLRPVPRDAAEFPIEAVHEAAGALHREAIA